MSYYFPFWVGARYRIKFVPIWCKLELRLLRVQFIPPRGIPSCDQPGSGVRDVPTCNRLPEPPELTEIPLSRLWLMLTFHIFLILFCCVFLSNKYCIEILRNIAWFYSFFLDRRLDAEIARLMHRDEQFRTWVCNVCGKAGQRLRLFIYLYIYTTILVQPLRPGGPGLAFWTIFKWESKKVMKQNWSKIDRRVAWHSDFWIYNLNLVIP